MSVVGACRWDLAFAFGPGAPKSLEDNFTGIIVDQQRNNNMLDDLASQYLSFEGSCNDQLESSIQLRFLQVRAAPRPAAPGPHLDVAGVAHGAAPRGVPAAQ